MLNFPFSHRLFLLPFSPALLLLCTGCFSIPQPPAGLDLLESALPNPEQVRKEWATHAQDGNVDSAWIKSFKDPALESYLDEVLTANLDLTAALHAVDAAAAKARQAGALLQPQLNAAGSASHLSSFQKSSRENDSTDVSAQLSWELDLWGRIRAGRAAAAANFRSTEAEYHNARLAMVGTAAKTWYLATETRLQLEFAREIVEIQQKRLDLVTIQFKEGGLSPKEKHLAGADLNSARDRLEQVRLSHRNAVRALELLAAEYPASKLGASSQYVPVPPSIPAGIPSELIERRPDLRSAQEKVATAFNLATEARAARLPRISLTAAAGRSSNDLIDLLGTSPDFWTAAANFIAPLYQGGALREQVILRTAEQKAALAQFGQKVLSAFNEVETALDGETILAKRERFLKAALDDNEEALRIAQTQFDAGKLDLLSVLQMQERVISAKITWISIRNARLAQRITLHLALGGSFD